MSEQVSKAVEEHKELDPNALALTLTLYRAMGAFERASLAEYSPYGLNTTQFNILTVLHRADGPMTMGQLGRAVAVRPANLTSLVDNLTRRSLVERRVNGGDRRLVFIAIAQAGEEFLADFLPSHWQYLELMMGGLTHEDRRRLLRLLEKLEQSLSAMPVEVGGQEKTRRTEKRLEASG